MFELTIRITSTLLSAALRFPGLQRVVINSSIVYNLGPVSPELAVTAATREALPDPVPTAFGNVFLAYITAKMVELRRSDDFVKQQNPRFSVTHVIPGYTYGCNELVLDSAGMQISNSSNTYLVLGMRAGELPFPIHGGYVHIDDLVDVHLKVVLSPGISGNYSVAKKIRYDYIFDTVEEAFPKAVIEGICERGKVSTLPIEYDSSETERFMGKPFRSF